MVRTLTCPHCGAPVKVPDRDDMYTYADDYRDAWMPPGMVKCEYCEGYSRVLGDTLQPVHQEELLKLEEQKTEPRHELTPEQEAMVRRRDRLQRDLEFYQSHQEVKRLRPSNAMAARL